MLFKKKNKTNPLILEIYFLVFSTCELVQNFVSDRKISLGHHQNIDSASTEMIEYTSG